jgi:DUF1365 family protein
MQSCLYECHIMHRRFAPKAHRFLYRIFLFAIDLDELDALHRRLAFFSVNRPNIYAFRERDYLPTGEPLHNSRTAAPAPAIAAASLKERVTAFLAANGVDLAGGRVMLVTLPRVFGYLFNPVSFYFCYDRSGAPVATLAEVTNTFKEMKPYVLGPPTQAGTGDAFRLRTPKYFYVSPYSEVDVDFDFILHPPAARLSIRIDDYVGPSRTLTSMLTGERRELTNARLAWFTLKYPLITLRVISLIHWHALLLWMKRVPWFAKSARADDQRALHRPHSSIAQPPAFAQAATPVSAVKVENC